MSVKKDFLIVVFIEVSLGVLMNDFLWVFTRIAGSVLNQRLVKTLTQGCNP